MKKNKLLIATTNQGKLNEFKQFLADMPLELVSLKDLGITEPVEEDGLSYEENSEKKALIYSKIADIPALADDAGLEIAALNGAPGVRSRRWLGYETTDEELFAHMAKVAKELPEGYRKAFFRASISFATPTGDVESTMGSIEGIIPPKPFQTLSKGYPYRSFFYLPTIKKYYHEADLTKEEIREYNHRYKALQKIKPIINKHYTVS